MAWFIIPIMAALHRFRGWVGWPYRLGNVMATLILAVALFLFGVSLWVVLIWAIGYLFWSLFSWSRWASLGHFTPAYGQGRALYWDEIPIEWMSRGNYYVALTLRFALPLIPLFGIFWYWNLHPYFLMGIPIIAVPAYWIGWKLWDFWDLIDPFLIAEIIVGAMWGLVIVLMTFQ